MVRVSVVSLMGAALVFSGLTGAAPYVRREDQAVGEEVAVSAPNGVPLSDTAELASQLATPTDASAAVVTPPPVDDSAVGTDGSDLSTVVGTDGETWVMSTYTAVQSDGSVSTYTYSTALPEETAPPAVEIPSSSSGESYSPPSYGSGSVSWQSGYNDCVQTCIVKYVPKLEPATYEPPSIEAPSPVVGSDGSDSFIPSPTQGSGYTIIVAPTQGVLRYVPPFMTIPPGETVNFVWNANNHTVTHSSIDHVCNKTETGPFASGIQLKGFEFNVPVNDTDPVFFYCGVPGHCEKGMFGILNPPMAPASSLTSIGAMFPQWTSSNPDLMSAWTYVHGQVAGTSFENWGSEYDVGSIDSSLHLSIASSVLYFRLVAALNPTAFNEQGTFIPGPGTKFPHDIPSILLATQNAGSSNETSTPVNTGTGSSGAPGSASTPQSSSARALGSSSFAVAAVSVLAAFFLL